MRTRATRTGNVGYPPNFDVAARALRAVQRCGRLMHGWHRVGQMNSRLNCCNPEPAWNIGAPQWPGAGWIFPRDWPRYASRAVGALSDHPRCDHTLAGRARRPGRKTSARWRAPCRGRKRPVLPLGALPWPKTTGSAPWRPLPQGAGTERACPAGRARGRGSIGRFVPPGSGVASAVSRRPALGAFFCDPPRFGVEPMPARGVFAAEHQLWLVTR
jgi:hypothetical protein